MGPGAHDTIGIAADGHPCEAALEFRRAVILRGIREEIPADALDLAISMAWIGKAVSRTIHLESWLQHGSDPNSWQAIRVMSLCSKLRATALEHAHKATAPFNRVTELDRIRCTYGFQSASRNIASLQPDDQRLRALASVAAHLPGRIPDLGATRASAKVIPLRRKEEIS